MEDLKKLLLQCEVYLQQHEWDKLIEALYNIKQEDIEKLDIKTAEECLRVLNHLIKEGEEIRNRMAENLVNLRKFKGGYGY